MSYTQLVRANYNVEGVLGYCLKYAHEVFGTPNLYPTAWSAWQNAHYKHTDQNLPTDVTVPVFFSGAGGAGHVVVYEPGVGYHSSPYSRASNASYQEGTTTHAVLPSISIIERLYGVTFAGWTEDINNVRVVQPQGGNVDGVNTVTATPKQVDDTINQIRIAMGYPDSALDDMLNTYRPVFKNNYISGVQTMLDNLLKDPNRPSNPTPGFTAYSGPALFVKN